MGAKLLKFVMAGPVPAIHVFTPSQRSETWMTGTSPGMTVQKLTSSLFDNGLTPWH
jgi:hypothetical protein